MLTKVPLNEVNARLFVTPAYAPSPPPAITARVESHPGGPQEELSRMQVRAQL